MIHSIRYTAVLDTNVIYPVIIRDLLFWFAYKDLYTPKWSEHIFDEWKRVIIEKGNKEEIANLRIEKANFAFPDAMVKNYKAFASLRKTMESGPVVGEGKGKYRNLSSSIHFLSLN